MLWALRRWWRRIRREPLIGLSATVAERRKYRFSLFNLILFWHLIGGMVYYVVKKGREEEETPWWSLGSTDETTLQNWIYQKRRDWLGPPRHIWELDENGLKRIPNPDFKVYLQEQRELLRRLEEEDTTLGASKNSPSHP